jgi:hypothetical protein
MNIPGNITSGNPNFRATLMSAGIQRGLAPIILNITKLTKNQCAYYIQNLRIYTQIKQQLSTK